MGFFFLLKFYFVLSFGTYFLSLCFGFYALDETAAPAVLKGWVCVGDNVIV